MTTAGDGALTSRDLDRSSLRPGDLERPLEWPSSTRRDILDKDELYLIQLSVLAKSDDCQALLFCDVRPFSAQAKRGNLGVQDKVSP